MVAANKTLTDLAHALGSLLTSRGGQLATAESCTGGWLAKIVTDVPGSSSWFGWGFVTYANEAKTGMLRVPESLLEQHGAVSEPVARAMAEGARSLSGAALAIAITGLAGPGGGTRSKPVGTVCFAWSTAAGTRSERCAFDGDRDAIRRQSVAHALRGGLDALERGSASDA